ncbi:MAG: acyltransferase [Intestinibacter sp.]
MLKLANVFINSNTLFMARGGITIEDDVQIAANCQLLSIIMILMKDKYQLVFNKEGSLDWCRDDNAWNKQGKHAIVGAASVVTHDVPDYSVAVGNPARVIKTLDKTKFKE